ncbi:MAG: response regulator [Cellulosilyticaceae bacterium]
MGNLINILMVDDHDLIREGIKRIIAFEDDFNVVGEGRNGKEAIALNESKQPDIILLDINMPIMDGITALKTIKASDMQTKVIILSVENDRSRLRSAIDIGADGYILKDSAGQEITNAIRSVYRGEKYLDQTLVKYLFDNTKEETSEELLTTLTEREIEILYKISQGLGNKEIGNQLYLSEKTIKNYATKIFRKLGVEDRVQATIYALKNNIQNYM